MSEFKGKVALVTGAGQGVGQGIALALATEGVDVAVVGRTEAKLADTAEQLRARGVRAEIYTADVMDTESIPGLVDQVAEEMGRLDILVNNAYSGTLGPLLQTNLKQFTKGFVSGPFAAFAFMTAAHPHLKAAGGGSIINLVTAAMVRWDLSNYGAYAAAKSALRSVSRTAAVEWASDGIRVNSIAPHALSPGLKWWIENNPEEAEEFIASIPMKYVGDPETDIGRAVVALCGQDMRYLTGATIPLDGGQAHFG
ncbi:SDR family NAD(P)-dependent oxidoreductase [Nocardioides daejeonensis]|uniref:SDR family NAD(P)-dependent oxidoreductase n=1 Tax=Nocardioides daejeonensis TaxID=1046556 RepID=UPI000D7506B3|nr:SDR family oxidoreductase [Nocardioides daejeonensis]